MLAGGVMESAIYTGTIRHRRFRPALHEFTYPLFLAFLDIDRIPELMRVSRLASYERWNWASFRGRDHFGDPRQNLRERLIADAAANDLQLPDGPVFLLTHLRYLGYNFSPVSFFFCFDAGQQLQMIMAEVKNTWAETHNYWMSAANQAGHTNNSSSYLFDKSFHVSPFLGMACQYRWTFTPPGESLVIHSNLAEDGAQTFDATLSLKGEPWSAKSLRRALFRFPLMTAKTVAAIHWEALMLHCKKVPFIPHPGPGRYKKANTHPLGANWSIR
jgi:DUF1365 family protein